MRLAAVSAFLAAFAAAVWFLAPAPPAGPGLYPVGPQPPTPLPYRFAIVDRWGNLVVTDREILWYEWVTHTIALRPTVSLDEIGRRWRGRPFSVVVDGATCYGGQFTIDQLSERWADIEIDLDPVQNREAPVVKIKLRHPEHFNGVDPRADDRIRTALRGSGKLRE